jgi:hypothetical protein
MVAIPRAAELPSKANTTPAVRATITEELWKSRSLTSTELNSKTTNATANKSQRQKEGNRPSKATRAASVSAPAVAYVEARITRRRLSVIGDEVYSKGRGTDGIVSADFYCGGTCNDHCCQASQGSNDPHQLALHSITVLI